MKFELCVTINLGNYQSVKLGVNDCNSFDEAVGLLREQVLEKKYPVDRQIRKILEINIIDVGLKS